MPYYTTGYLQEFTHPVNTFPRKVKVVLNGKKLKPGIDYILDPASKGLKGKFQLNKADSVTFTAKHLNTDLHVQFRKKLTFSVSKGAGSHCAVLLDKQMVTDEPVSIKVNIKNREIEQFKSRNIVAFVQGTSKSDSLIVFSAHYDHLGGMGRRTFFPGANDNASGVSMLLNLARFYKISPPRYKTVFIFFAAEEIGLLGSAHMVKSGDLPLQKVRFLINLDLLGTGEEGIMAVNGAIHENRYNTLVNLNDAYDLVKEVKMRGKAANSDHYHFTEAGVPAFFIYTMGGTTAYHDVYDVAKSLPLTEYRDLFELIRRFVETL